MHFEPALDLVARFRFGKVETLAVMIAALEVWKKATVLVSLKEDM